MMLTKIACLKTELKKTRFGKKLVRLKKTAEKKLFGRQAQGPEERSFRKTRRNILNDGVKKAVTVADLSRDYCTGCTACAAACPAGAIKMVRSAEGFLESDVDSTLCVRCSKCVKVCPVLTPRKDNNAEPPCFAVMASDEVRRDSSSGGAFTLLAEHILDRGGYVCGAAFDENFVVRHMIIHDKAELPKLRRSKYVQSDVGDVFRQIRALLDAGELVLFTGSPCQVAGLRGCLGKLYPNLLLADIVCHGAPSQLVFDRYIEDKYGRDNLERFEFRTKEYGYNCVHQIAHLKDGRKIAVDHAFDAYEQCMHSGISLKDVCAECPFAPAPRQGDVTIGDFWGIDSYKRELNDRLGTSVFLVNTPRGEAVWNAIRPNCKLAEPVPFDVARKHNRFGSHMRVPAGRDWLFRMMKNRPFDDALDYAINRKFDIGVVGLWYGVNYGSMATYYALHETLKRMNLSILMIENALSPDHELVQSKTHPRRIADRFYDISPRYPLNRMKELNASCDTFIVGSDQLWNVGLSRAYKQTYYLGFVDDNKKKISLATSFGKPYAGTPEEQLISSHNLRRFDHVSVRDELSKCICRDWGIEAEVLCDPTLFLHPADYEPLIAMTGLRPEKEPYILAYILDPDENTGDFLHAVARKEMCRVLLILDLNPKMWEKRRVLVNAERFDDVVLLGDIGLPEWLWYYKHAESVITDSFHGTIFSVIYQKPFLSKINEKRGGQRFVSLLAPLNLQHRMFENFDNILTHAALLNALDYSEADEKLAVIRSRSLAWLKNALFTPKMISSRAIYNIYTKTDISSDKNAREIPDHD